MKKILIVAIGFSFVVSGFLYTQNNKQKEQISKEKPSLKTTVGEESIEIVAENLEIPWEIAFLPTGEMLVTERPGRVVKIGENREVIEVEGVEHIGEGGLLGLALDPNFSQNNFVYLYLTTTQNEKFVNRVEKYRLDGNTLIDKKLIIGGITGAAIHDGGRIAFGPDGYLYITTGDAGKSSLAQDKNSLNGKILRVKEDGVIPDDNLFKNAVYSYGHRNSQGLAWDESQDLWATEHGRSGVLSGLDEINRIEKGKNYGWPIIQGDDTKEGMVSPIIHSSDDTWAPSGVAFLNGSLFFAGLRGEALYEYKIKEKVLKEHFKKRFGRLRAVVVSPNGFLYISTSNRDGRGSPKASDDKIIKINAKKL